MTKRRAPREGSFIHWLSKRLDWPNDKLQRHVERAGFGTKSLQNIHRARHHLRKTFGLGEVVDQSKSHPKTKTKNAPKKQRASKQKQPTAIEVKQSHLRRLFFELGWDLSLPVVHEFQQLANSMGATNASQVQRLR